MESKTFEIRDDGTFIPVLAVRLTPETERDRYLLARAGYGANRESQERYVWIAMLSGGHGKSGSDPYEWQNGRTMQKAHQFILKNWDQLTTGAVVDVEFLLGETITEKVSEAYA